MPQLDIYTYFSQFQWFLVIFSLLFILINGKYITTFQSFFFSRNRLLDYSTTAINESNFKLFDIKLKKETQTAKNTIPLAQWDKIYEKIRLSKKVRNKSNKKKSVKKSKTKQKNKK
jgi:hypothetical protein